MESFKSHKREIFWYNIHVPRERSSTFFDIGGRHPAPAIGPKPVWADGKTPESTGRFRRNRRRGRAVASRPTLGRVVSMKPPPCVPRDRLSGELRKRIRRPQHVRNSVLVLPRKPLLSTDEAKIRCCAVWQSCGATSFPLLRPGS